MSILRINEFYAMPKKFSQLTVALMEILPSIQNIPGCESCELLTSTEGQEKVVIIEKWSSIDAHKAGTKYIDPQAFMKIMAMLKGKPTGKYYQTATEF